MSVGKLQKVKLRDVWQHEAHNFTKWLENNIEYLNDVTGLFLGDPRSEKSVGSFSVDIDAQDDLGRRVVIENQLEKTDHDHLGKLITYLSNLDAEIGIWIVSEARPEHIKAVNWLNETSADSIYLVKVEAYKIDDSNPAVHFTLIAGPSEIGKAVGKSKKQFNENEKNRYRYWEQLLNKAHLKTKLHSSVKPNSSPWIYHKENVPGIYFAYNVNLDRCAVAVYIDHGEDKVAENQDTFSALKINKEAIETAFGKPLEWFKKENTRVFRIQLEIADVGYRDEEDWDALQDSMIDSMILLEKATRPYINQLGK